MTHPVMFLRLHIRRDVESHFIFAGHHSLCWNMLSCSTSMQISLKTSRFSQSQALSSLACSAALV